MPHYLLKVRNSVGFLAYCEVYESHTPVSFRTFHDSQSKLNIL